MHSYWYDGTVTRLKVSGSLSDKIQVNRGVWQGDPLLPLLFNYVMDWALNELDPEVRLLLADNVKLNHLAFADGVSRICNLCQYTVCFLLRVCTHVCVCVW